MTKNGSKVAIKFVIWYVFESECAVSELQFMPA